MAGDSAERAARRQRLAEVLLGYLHAHWPPEWPGADGITVEEVLRSYPQALKAGRVPGVQELRRRHPELADELGAFLAGLAHPEPKR